MKYIWACQFQRELVGIISGSGYSSLIGLSFDGASFESFMNAFNFTVKLDTSISNHLILWINDFGIKRPKGGTVWEPQRIVDLSGINISMRLERDPPPRGPFFKKFETPVKKVEIYVNSLAPHNRIATAIAKYQEQWGDYGFCPIETSSLVDEYDCSFYFDLYELRKGILDSIRRNYK